MFHAEICMYANALDEDDDVVSAVDVFDGGIGMFLQATRKVACQIRQVVIIWEWRGTLPQYEATLTLSLDFY
jgi:hypothetical protein